MNRGARLAALAGLALVGAGAVVTGRTMPEREPEPGPTPSRVYSSCLAADTSPPSADNDPCGGR